MVSASQGIAILAVTLGVATLIYAWVSGVIQEEAASRVPSRAGSRAPSEADDAEAAGSHQEMIRKQKAFVEAKEAEIAELHAQLRQAQTRNYKERYQVEPYLKQIFVV